MDKEAAKVIELDKPYVGWLDHFSSGWQVVVVRKKQGQRTAYRLGDPVSYERAVEMCLVLSEAAGLPVAGELRKDGFLPKADEETAAK